MQLTKSLLRGFVCLHLSFSCPWAGEETLTVNYTSAGMHFSKVLSAFLPENVFYRGEGQVIRDGNTVLDSNDEDDALISYMFVIFTSL